jgi:hypothetical protein
MKGEEVMKWNKTYTGYTIFGGLIGAGITGCLCIYTDGFTNDKTKNVGQVIKELMCASGKKILRLAEGE